MAFEYPEGATPIDPDEAEGLLLTHITTRGELDRWEQDNIVEALTWLDRVKPADILNEKFIKELHRRMFGNVWRWAGRFRKSDKNIGGPWHQVPTNLKNLCDDARLWLDLREESPDHMGVRFHHRLVSIHPFPNGNGRHARPTCSLKTSSNVQGLHGATTTCHKAVMPGKDTSPPCTLRIGKTMNPCWSSSAHSSGIGERKHE